MERHSDQGRLCLHTLPLECDGVCLTIQVIHSDSLSCGDVRETDLQLKVTDENGDEVKELFVDLDLLKILIQYAQREISR